MPTIDAASLLRLLHRQYLKGDSDRVRENFFTDCLRAALADDQPLARAFVRLLIDNGDFLDRIRVANARISVATQVREGRDCILDLVLDVEAPSGRSRRIAVEHKFDAPEGTGQLRKYINLPGV